MNEDIDQIVARIDDGASVNDELLPIVYDELKALASRKLSMEAVDSLETTELVHEAYLRLVGSNQQWDGRAHFFSAAAESMRRVLVDRARKRNSLKRGGSFQRGELHESAIESTDKSMEILEVNELFDQLAALHPLEADVAKLRYFAGFSLSEVAGALNISVGSAHKRWHFAKAWLYRENQKAKPS